MTTTWDSLQKGSLSQKNQFRKLEFVAAKKSLLILSENKVSTATGANATNSTGMNKDSTGAQKQSLFDQKIADKYLKWNKVSKVGPGFFNDGNTCYLNSTLQCLVHTPALAQILLYEPRSVMRSLNDTQASADGNFERRDGQSMRPILHHFHSLVGDVWHNSSGRAIAPRSMTSSIKRVGRQFKPMRQEDAHEYLRQLLDTMHEEILKANGKKTSDGKIAETTMFSRVFGGYLCNTLSCSKCNFHSRTFNHFQDLSLDINQGIKSVTDAIEAFTKPEYLTAGNEWKCEKCNQKVKAKKQMTLSSLPNVLVIQLKRFSFGNMFAKITKPIQFKETLYLSEDKKAKAEANGGAVAEESAKVKYELYGVIVHHGHSTHSGHYIAYVKAPNGQWYEMNDSHVSAVSLQTVLNCQAYILFYTRGAKSSSNGVEVTKSDTQSAKTSAADAADTTTQESASGRSSEGSSPRATPLQANEDLGEAVAADKWGENKKKDLINWRFQEEAMSTDDSEEDSSEDENEEEGDSSDDDDYTDGSSDSSGTSDSDDTELAEDEEDFEADECRSYDGIRPFPFRGIRHGFGKWRFRKVLPIRELIALQQKITEKDRRHFKTLCVVRDKHAVDHQIQAKVSPSVTNRKSLAPTPAVASSKSTAAVPSSSSAKKDSSVAVSQQPNLVKPVYLSANATASTAPSSSSAVPIKITSNLAPVTVIPRPDAIPSAPSSSSPRAPTPKSTVTPTAAGTATTSAVLPAPKQPILTAPVVSAPSSAGASTAAPMDIVKQLQQHSMRGRDSGGEGVWETVSPQYAQAAEALNKKQRREQQKERKSRKPDDWNAMLDSGKVKKVKISNDDDDSWKQRRDASGKIINPFQEMSNRIAK